jgi:hypothetical protein
MRKALVRAQRSHLELRTLTNASQFGIVNNLTSGVAELNTSYQQLTKWYEEGHYLVDDCARIHNQMWAVKDTMHPKSFKKALSKATLAGRG